MREIVINTGPVIALVAATGTLDWLTEIYDAIWVPYEVDTEIRAGGPAAPESAALRGAANVVHILPPLTLISRVLVNELDSGEASVIQTALQKNVSTVAIDEKAGRAGCQVEWTQGHRFPRNHCQGTPAGTSRQSRA